jgi:hypothetical protein
MESKKRSCYPPHALPPHSVLQRVPPFGISFLQELRDIYLQCFDSPPACVFNGVAVDTVSERAAFVCFPPACVIIDFAVGSVAGLIWSSKSLAFAVAPARLSLQLVGCDTL